MGLDVTADGKAIWLPSVRVGALYADQMKALEGVIDRTSGIESHLADTLEINAEAFAGFIRAMLQRLETTNNEPLLALAEGCIALSIALNFRITGRWPDTSARTAPIVARAQFLLDHMT